MKEMLRLDNVPCYGGFFLNPIPDFLEDNRFAAKDSKERLQEHLGQWTQLIRGLWKWCDTASFCLRYVGGVSKGRVDIYLLFSAKNAKSKDSLKIDLSASLASLRIPATEIDRDIFANIGFAGRTVATAVTQHVARMDLSFPKDFDLLGNVETPKDATPTYLVYPWWGPEGSYRFPFESLARATSPVIASVYLQPTTLTQVEHNWLRYMAATASSLGEQTRTALGVQNERLADPAATMAADLYLSQFRRLTHPFLSYVQIVTSLENAAENFHVAGIFDGIVRERSTGDAASEKPLPSGADIFPGGFDFGDWQYHNLFFPDSTVFANGQLQDPDGNPPGLSRFRFLVDAEGAGTVFRLPVGLKAGVPGIRVEQQPPDFHPGPRIIQVPNGHLVIGKLTDGGLMTIPIEDLTKHTLVTGFTGSGKTVTVLSLLHQAWNTFKVPFLVLESAKQEYRGLFGVSAFRDALRIYTPGNETAVPFRLNPFELLPGTRVESHIGRLQVCFEAAMPPIGPSASVIAESLVSIYEQCGWMVTDICSVQSKRRFPTMSDFVSTVKQVIAARDYQGEVKSNVTAAIVGRLTPLLIGSKKRMFDCQKSSPSAEELFSRPTILELNDLNLDDKALVVIFLLTHLREYRELTFRSTSSAADKLAHITVVEEAHNVLSNVRSEGRGEGAGADTKFKAVEALCTMLAEVRALGEGLIIADQSPEKLAPDAIRNTNLQIAHQLRDAQDRKAIANAMIMTEEQQEFLGKLKAGHAAIFRTGLERATFINVPPYYPINGKTISRSIADGTGFNRNLTDAELVKFMDQVEPNLKVTRSLLTPYHGCADCRSKCLYRDVIFPETRSNKGRKVAEEFAGIFRLSDSSGATKFVALAADEAAKRLGVKPDLIDFRWCYLLHIIDLVAPGKPIDPVAGGWTFYEAFQTILRFSRLSQFKEKP
jgi:hypothetical protein